MSVDSDRVHTCHGDEADLSREDVAELMSEAESLLETALKQSYALWHAGSSVDAGQLLRSVHSYKSLAAFAGAGEQAGLAGKLEDYVQAIWLGRVPVIRADHDLVHRTLLALRSHGEPTTTATRDLTSLADDLAEAVRRGPNAARPNAYLPERRPETDARDNGSPGVYLSIGQLTELYTASHGIVGMARRLSRDTLPDDPHRDELIEALLCSADRLESRLRRYVRQSLRSYLLPLTGAIQAMAACQGKHISARLDVPEIDVDRSFLQALRPSILHLLRNAVAHGIEAPEVRVAAGKPPQGRITLSGEVSESRLYLTVYDDGQGFDVDTLHQAAESAGLLKPSQTTDVGSDDALSLAALPGLSTKAVTDELSGRGLGLTVVVEDIGVLGGTVKLESLPGEYSRVTLEVPLPSPSEQPPAGRTSA